jgi:hypothetical protein
MHDHMSNRIFKPSPGFMSRFYPFGNKLADFETAVTLRQCAMYLFGTHDELQS